MSDDLADSVLLRSSNVVLKIVVIPTGLYFFQLDTDYALFFERIYRVIKKSPCTWRFYSTIIRCTEPFWSLYISKSGGVLQMSACSYYKNTLNTILLMSLAFSLIYCRQKYTDRKANNLTVIVRWVSVYIFKL